MVLTSNNAQLIIGCLDFSIRVYGLKSGNLMKLLQGHESYLQSVQLLPSNQYLLSSAEDGVLLLWNLLESDPKAALVRRIETPA